MCPVKVSGLRERKAADVLPQSGEMGFDVVGTNSHTHMQYGTLVLVQKMTFNCKEATVKRK